MLHQLSKYYHIFAMSKRNKTTLTMKRNIFILLLCLLFLSCNKQEKKIVIGVSQCSEDIWRNKLNEELTTGTFFYDNVDLLFASADDSDQKQIQQIEDFLQKGIDLLIVSPNQVSTVSPAIDKAYDMGIPVIVFDRKTYSKKFSAYIGADNRDIGRQMGEYIAVQLGGKGKVMEIKGLKDSSPAIERHKGFVEALSKYPQIKLVTSLQGDWSGASAQKATADFIVKNRDEAAQIDYVYGQNDRMAIGAQKSFESLLQKGQDGNRLPKFVGVDGLAGKGGGLELVESGQLDASYIYPTRGDEVLQLAMMILQKKKYKKDNPLKSALVTKENAHVLLMQSEEIQRQHGYLNTLHQQSNETLKTLNMQKAFIITFIVIVFLLIAACVYAYYAYLTKARYSEQLRQSYENELELKREVEALKDAQIHFYTNVSHELRTPLTLISGPLTQLESLPVKERTTKEASELLSVVTRNTGILTSLVNKILEAERRKEESFVIKDGKLVFDDKEEEKIPSQSAPPVDSPVVFSESNEDLPSVLVVDDNDDVRLFLHTILKDKYIVTEAENGQKGLEAAKNIVPDLIISDVMMPVMNGLEFCQQVKDNMVTSHIPVILLTARAMSEHQIEGYQHGADAYITKPFDHRMLLVRVENLLKNREKLKTAWKQGVSTVLESTTSSSSSSQDKAELSQRDTAFLSRLKTIIEKHLTDGDFGVEQVGSEIGLSRVQLYRKVKAITGLSPVEMLRKMRLEKARELLLTTDKTISEAAYEAGFSAPSYFTKCFKEEFGILPGDLIKG